VQARPHHGLVEVLERWDDADGHVCLALRYHGTVTLQDHVAAERAAGRWKEAAWLRAALHVCQALAYLHEHGVAHGDVSPGNVTVMHDGGGAAWYVLGLPLVARGEGVDCTAGMSVGTLLYQAPEVLREGAISRGSDVWSLGLLLHQLAAGDCSLNGCPVLPHRNSARITLAAAVSAVESFPGISVAPQPSPEGADELLSYMTAVETGRRPAIVDVAATVAAEVADHAVSELGLREWAVACHCHRPIAHFHTSSPVPLCRASIDG